ncbi:cell division protein FtsL [Methylomarinovum tepidoasis]|uniref:Cell division protein FtsL n=1 Tax=Methylomarinovum tepidoasis TaxID=2840183 RepID=A0AAU9CK69_9GAMM|nr:cell division protein FtsL [Methylomarinovum sp. IN45]BCX88027.1 cell division protein FtsL [Methylomarinovum sp. IN45]
MKLALLTGILGLAVIVSAIGVVYGKYRSRMLFNEIQRLTRRLDALAVEREQLLLEEHVWADPARIEHLAQQRLDMVAPEADAIVYLTVPRR